MPAAAWTSSRETVPFGPVGVSSARSTPRSLASLRTGGLASARTAPGSPSPRPAPSPRRGDRARSAPRSAGTGFSSAVDHVLGPGATGRERTLQLGLGGGTGVGRGRRRAATGAALRATVGLVAADQALALAATAGGRVGQVDLHLGRRRSGGRGSRRRPTVADRDDRGADRDHLALGDQQRLHGAGVRRRQLDQGLGGLDLDDDVVDLDGVALLDLPGDDLGLGETLTDVGQLELSHGQSPSQKSRVRSTASRTRSRSGRKSSSIREAGYGVSNPPTRSTGDSRE